MKDSADEVLESCKTDFFASVYNKKFTYEDINKWVEEIRQRDSYVAVIKMLQRDNANMKSFLKFDYYDIILEVLEDETYVFNRGEWHRNFIEYSN